jgi:cytochrome o ubiquinol oxidase subunit II
MGSEFPVLDPAGPIAAGELHVIIVTLLLCALVVVPVFFLLFYFAYKYHADCPTVMQTHRPDWDHDNWVAEFFWWSIPTIIIGALGILAWQSAHQLDPYRPLPGQAITVEVVALDWKWLFIYPDYGVATVNKLELPVGTPVHFLLTADAPMNSFWIPQLGGQIMVMPGMQTQLNLEASRAGTFNGFSANISGAGFAGMAFSAQALSPSDFAAWVASARASTSTPLTMNAYQSLAQPSSYNAPAQYAPVAGGLYTGIMMKYMAPGSSMSGMDMAMPGMSM